MKLSAYSVGTVLRGTYRIERLIAEGGMGSVYEVSHTRLARRFAAKLLLPEFANDRDALNRFRREVQSVSAIGHPHVLEVLDFNYTKEGVPFMVTELLEGEDLCVYLRENDSLELEQAAPILWQACAALQAAHDANIVHRDLKPSNVFLCRRGEYSNYVKVLDFGISKVLGAAPALTQSRMLFGTPAYMSPEQAEEKSAEVDQRSDIYSLTVVLYQMLTGQPPFMAKSVPSLLFKIVCQDPPLPRTLAPKIPHGIERVLLRGLAKKPEDRFPSMSSLWSAFSRELAQEGVIPEVPTGTRELKFPQPEGSVSGNDPHAPTLPFKEHAGGETAAPTESSDPGSSLASGREQTTASTTAEFLGHLRRRRRRQVTYAAIGLLLLTGVIVWCLYPSDRSATKDPIDQTRPQLGTVEGQPDARPITKREISPAKAAPQTKAMPRVRQERPKKPVRPRRLRKKKRRLRQEATDPDEWQRLEDGLKE